MLADDLSKLVLGPALSETRVKLHLVDVWTPFKPVGESLVLVQVQSMRVQHACQCLAQCMTVLL